MKKILLLILLSISAQLFAQNKEWVDMNPPLSYGTSTVREVFSIGNDIYAFTGIASVSQALPVKIEKWNASTNTWTVHVNDFELAVPFDKIEIKVEENKAYIATINHTTTFFYTFDGSTTMNTLFSWYGGGDVLFTSWDISVATNKIAVLAYGNGLGLEYLDLGSGSQMVYTTVTTTVSDTASLYINDNTDKAYVVEKVGSNMFAHSYDFVSQTVSQVYPAPFNISNSLTNTTASSNNNQFYLAPSQQEFPYLVYEEAAAGANAGIYAVLLDGLATSTEAVKITNDPVFNSFSLRSSNTEMSVVTGVNNAGSEFVNIFNFDYASGDVSTEGTINLPNDGTSRVRKTIGAISMGNQFLSLASDSEIAFKFLNTIPVRTSFYAGTPCVNNGDDIIDSIYVTDAEGANITMTYTGSSDASIINTANNQPVFTLNNAPVYYYLELNGGPFQTAGSCYVYYSLTDGLSTVNDSIAITVNANPTLTWSVPSYEFCNTDAVYDLHTDVSLTGGVFTNSLETPMTNIIDPATIGYNSIIYKYTDANGCVAQQSKNITINNTAVFNFNMDTSAFCNNVNDIPLAILGNDVSSAGGTLTYKTVPNNISIGNTINPATFTSSSVEGTSTTSPGCVSKDTVYIKINQLATINYTQENYNVCEGQTLDLNTYVDQTGATFYLGTSSTSLPGDSYDTGMPGTNQYIKAEYNDPNGCGVARDTAYFNTVAATNSTTTITACDTYTWTDNMTYTTSGIYMQTLVNALGCDSIATLQLTINQATNSTTTEVACASYTWTDGMTYTTSGTYTQTLVNALGCDSTATLSLTINQPTSSTTTEVACATYTWTDGMTYTTSGTYTQTITNAVGCDSVATLNLTINQPTSSTTTEIACATYTWTDGMTYTTSGTYTQTLTNAVGCDSIATLNLTINQTTNSTTTEVACNTYTWTDGMTYTTSGTYTQTLVNAVGCDSIATLNLTINQATSSTTTEVACVSYIWTDGMTYTTSGTYTQTLTNAVGCDSIATLELTINQPSAYTDLITACDTYTWIDGNTYTASNNTATHTITNAVGCDSVITLDLTINESPMVNFTQSTYEFCSNGGQVDINTMVDVPGGEFSFNGIPVQTNNGWLDIVGLSAGTLDYNFIDVTTGCSATATSSFNVINPATITLTITDAACGNPSGEIEANIVGANGNYFTYWSNGESQVNQIQNLAPGAYYVNVEDDQGCIATALGNVASTEFDLTSSITNPTCAGDNDGAIDITLTGITAGYSVLWSTGASQEDVTGLSAGTHQVVITLDNGCSVTEDFVLLDPLPINMTPNITEANCGSTDGTVFFTLENAVGTIQYLWDNGSTQQSLLNIAGGNYELTVTDANGCTATQAVSLLNQNTAELTAAVTPTDCGSDNGAIDLFIPEIEGTNVQAILWSNTDVTEDLTALPAGAYGVQVTYDNGCNTYGNWQVSTKAPLQNDICLVTVDSLTTTNLVVWEKVQNATDGIDFYNIYRETSTAGEFLKIHEVEVEDESIFNDVVASPTTRSWRYKISAVNNCGVEGPLSSWHKTIHTVFSESPVQGEFNVSWDDYEGLTYSTVNLYRFTTNDGWELIGDNLPASQYQFTDTPTFTDQLDYMVEIMVDEICSSSEGKAQDFNSTRSNKTKGIFNPGEGTGDPNNGLEEFINDNFTVSVYPNPTAGLLNISAEFNNGNDFLKIRITDVLGKVKLNSALENGTSEIRLDHLQAGTYFITITDEEQTEIFRVVKQ